MEKQEIKLTGSHLEGSMLFLATFLQAFNLISEEYLMKKYNIDKTKLTGLEGII